jgi:hypothetical protein
MRRAAICATPSVSAGKEKKPEAARSRQRKKREKKKEKKREAARSSSQNLDRKKEKFAKLAKEDMKTL